MHGDVRSICLAIIDVVEIPLVAMGVRAIWLHIHRSAGILTNSDFYTAPCAAVYGLYQFRRRRRKEAAQHATLVRRTLSFISTKLGPSNYRIFRLSVKFAIVFGILQFVVLMALAWSGLLIVIPGQLVFWITLILPFWPDVFRQPSFIEFCIEFGFNALVAALAFAALYRTYTRRHHK